MTKTDENDLQAVQIPNNHTEIRIYPDNIDMEHPSLAQIADNNDFGDTKIPFQRSISASLQQAFKVTFNRAKSIPENILGSTDESIHINQEHLVQKRVENKLIELGILT